MKRILSIVGVLYELLAAYPDSVYAFPRYNKTSNTNINSGSAALNKWLHSYVLGGCTMHSFRHLMMDRFRAAVCPVDAVV